MYALAQPERVVSLEVKARSANHIADSDGRTDQQLASTSE